MDLDALVSPSWRLRRQAIEDLEGLDRMHSGALAERLVTLVRTASGDLNALNAALQALARLGPEVVPQVVPLLHHPEPEARQAAILVLGRFHHPVAFARMAECLGDADPNVRYHAVEALGTMGFPAAARDLAALLDPDDFFLAFPVLEALAELGEPAALPELLALASHETLGDEARGALARVAHPAAVPALMERLGPDAELLLLVARLARRTGERPGSGGPVERWLQARAPGVSGRLLEGWRAWRDRGADLAWLLVPGLCEPACFQPLVALLDGEDEAPEEAALALLRWGPAAFGALRRRLECEDGRGRQWAARLLGEMGDSEAVPALVAVVREGDPAPAAEALRALGRLGSPGGVVEALRHPHAVVRQAAVEAGRRLGPPAPPEVVDLARQGVGAAVSWLGAVEAEARRDLLLESLREGAPAVAAAAAEALAPAAGTDAEVLEAFSEQIETGLPPVRAVVARALAGCPLEAVRPLLRSGLHDENLWVRIHCVRALARDPAAAADLQPLLHDPSPAVRAAAAEAVGAAGRPEDLSVLAARVRDDEVDVVLGAVEGLASGGLPEAAGVLAALLQDPRGQLLRRAAAAGLGRVGGPVALQALRGALEDPEVALIAVEALARVSGPEATDLLVEALSRPNLKEAACRALAARGPGTVGRLERRLAEASGFGEAAPALEALARVGGPEAAAAASRAMETTDPWVRRKAVLTASDLGAPLDRPDPDPAVATLIELCLRLRNRT